MCWYWGNSPAVPVAELTLSLSQLLKWVVRLKRVDVLGDAKSSQFAQNFERQQQPGHYVWKWSLVSLQANYESMRIY